MENKTSQKSEWQKPELIDFLDVVDTSTSKAVWPTEGTLGGSNRGPSS